MPHTSGEDFGYMLWLHTRRIKSSAFPPSQLSGPQHYPAGACLHSSHSADQKLTKDINQWTPESILTLQECRNLSDTDAPEELKNKLCKNSTFPFTETFQCSRSAHVFLKDSIHKHLETLRSSARLWFDYFSSIFNTPQPHILATQLSCRSHLDEQLILWIMADGCCVHYNHPREASGGGGAIQIPGHHLSQPSEILCKATVALHTPPL